MEAENHVRRRVESMIFFCSLRVTMMNVMKRLSTLYHRVNTEFDHFARTTPPW